MSLNYGFVAYIDEAGDPGLKKVIPLDKDGASEWLILSATLIRTELEKDVPQWGREFLSQCGGKQQNFFHFRKANDNNKLFACERLSALPVRNFVVCCNKKNMRGYNNRLAAKRNVDLDAHIKNANWFYYWVARILLEKVTNFASWYADKKGMEDKHIKFEFSQRGGIRYDEVLAYMQLLRENDHYGTQTITYDQIDWSVVDECLIEVHPHTHRAGLIMPDIVASSFYMACDKYERGLPCQPQQAFRLGPRMARRYDNRKSTAAGFGVKLMPNHRTAKLESDQQQIFKKYGYKFK